MTGSRTLPRLCSVLVWTLFIMGCCFSKEFTQTGTGNSAVSNTDQPPTQGQKDAACLGAKSDATSVALSRCTAVGGTNCKVELMDPCTFVVAPDGSVVTATVTGHYKCCD
jgi:hypothetical protein